MKIFSKELTISTHGETDIIDITGHINEVLSDSKMKEGTATVFIPGATAGLTTIEYEHGLIEDLKKAYERIAPRRAKYEHNARWGDGNGFSHIRASMTRPDITIPFVDGQLTLGTWQQIVLIDFDNRQRQRKFVVQLTGQ